MLMNIANGMINALKKRPTETSLVRMFQIEYNKDYNFARKNGVDITEGFVKEFLREQRA